jgi:hypothetical protein
MSCEVHSDPRFFGGAATIFCFNDDGFCRRCGLPIVFDTLCEVCVLLQTNRPEALALARKVKFSVGPFCQFCESDEETVLCDWPVMKPTPKRTELAEVGDVWITKQAGKRARIVEIENLDKKREVVLFAGYGRRIWVLIPGHPKPYPYDYCNHNGMFTTEAPGTCDRQCCWRHQREVGENRHHCKAHWDSWQGGIAA